MTDTDAYDRKTTALLCIDFYNDFLSEEGKLWPWVKDMAKEVNLLDNLHTIVRTARELGITVCHVPLVRDATAARSPEAMHAAMDIDGPTYAHAILTTAELVAALKS